MKTYNEFGQGLSTLMIFVFLIQLSGCYSTKQISASDLTNSYKYFYVVHDGDKSYQLIGASITNGTLSGLVSSVKPIKENSVHFYVNSNFQTEIKTGKNISIDLADISKIEQVRSNTAGNILLGLAGLIGLITIIIILSFTPTAGWSGI